MTQQIVISMGVHHLGGFLFVFSHLKKPFFFATDNFTHFVRGYWSTWMYQKNSKWFVKGI